MRAVEGIRLGRTLGLFAVSQVKGVSSVFGQNPPRKQVNDDGRRLWIQEVFYTLQGEGPLTGQAAVFVRLAGCNLRCFWCDTDFESSTWTPTIEELLSKIERVRPDASDLVVVTGGEPLRQNIVPLIEALLANKLRVQIETSGTLWVELPDHPSLSIVCSPKTKSIHPKIVSRITAYKYVLASGAVDPDDGLPSQSTQMKQRTLKLYRPPPGAVVYVMPRDDVDSKKNKENMRECVNVAMKFGYILSLQTHKILGLD